MAKRQLGSGTTVPKMQSPMLQRDSKVSKGTSFFHENVNLAVSMGFYIAIFCLPVCSKFFDDLLFVKLDVASLMWATDTEMKAQWPLVFTLMFFMVLKNTGTTVQNAWGGFMGIVVATSNIAILAHFFPQGAKCKTLSKDPIAMGLRHSCDEYADENYGSIWGWLVWINFALYIFLELAAQCPESFKKWGMTQMIAYMMGFMNYAGFHFSFAQIITSFLGLFLGICVTLVPNIAGMVKGKKMNFAHFMTLQLRHYPEELVERIAKVLLNSIHFLDKSAELDRHTRTSMRFALESEVDEIAPVVSRMQETFDASTWEKSLCRIFCRYKRWKQDRKHVRRFTNAFGDNVGGFDDLFYMIKKVVLSDDHQNYTGLMGDERKSVDRERDLVKRQLFDLTSKTSDHLCKIARPPGETLVDDYDEDAAIREIEEKAKTLRRAYALIPDLPEDATKPRERLRNQLGCYVFAILCYSRQVCDTFGEETRDIKDTPTTMKEDLKDYFLGTFGDRSKDGYKFLAKFRTDPDTKFFVVRNFVSIFSCFVMGNFFQGNVFPGFSATCASTLALLISHYPGSAFETNLNRLLGLTLGKVVPIIIMAVVSIAGNSGPLEVVVHLGMIWAYESFFAYIYYTSTDWGGMGALVAGFGCGALIGTRSTTWSGTVFKTQYMEIGQVTACIMVQMVVDVLDTIIRKRWPRDLVVTNMAKLGMLVEDDEKNHHQTQQLLGSKDMDGAIVKAFRDFMSMTPQSMEDMLKCIKDAKDLCTEQERLIEECRPRSVVVRGPRTPFKYTTGKEAFKWIKLLMQEMELLYMVYKKGPRSAATPEPQFVHNLHLDEDFQKTILETMRLTFMDLQTIFKHDQDGVVQRPYTANPPLTDPDMNWRIRDGTMPGQDPAKFRRDLCVCVAQRALFDSLGHVSEIQHACYTTGCFAYEKPGEADV